MTVEELLRVSAEVERIRKENRCTLARAHQMALKDRVYPAGVEIPPVTRMLAEAKAARTAIEAARVDAPASDEDPLRAILAAARGLVTAMLEQGDPKAVRMACDIVRASCDLDKHEADMRARGEGQSNDSVTIVELPSEESG